MATAKPSRSSRSGNSSQPKQSISKVEQARRTFIGNPAQTDQASFERQRRALKQAELEKKVQQAYEKQYRLSMVAASKMQARRDAAADVRRQTGLTPGKPAKPSMGKPARRKPGNPVKPSKPRTRR